LCFPVCFVLLLLTVRHAGSDELPVSRFSVQGLTGWEEKIFKGATAYQLVREDGRTVVKGVSKGSASGLVRKITFNPKEYRYLRWSWKIDTTLADGFETKKSGDDYAARVYVVFSGRFFWQTRAINYIWANHLPPGESIPNAYTSSAMMIAVQSGPENAGRWLAETRDIYSDYINLFGSEPGEASAIAIMTDTDDTGGSAIGWYGEITLATQR
jgi:hypothetical protein